MFSELTYEIADDVAVIRLNRPESLNAMSEAMARELYQALCRAEREARAILLCGAGRGFCSGANLTGDTFDFDDPTLDAGSTLEPLMNPIVTQMRMSQAPIVTVVQGPAAGIGCAIALAGDLIVASEAAYFFQAFAKIGLVPDGGSTYLLTRAIGRPRAMEMMLLGGKIRAQQALDWGLINRVTPPDQLEATARALALEIARGPRSLGLIKRLTWSVLDEDFGAAMLNERFGQREAGLTKDFREGVTAFREKRPPQFSGE